ncbi:hypothetical protein Glove_117g459 [Diversispora epigaea]|uniref:Uncharacterized protein n=1 Tax=Diversispora epigaea TaxID=1348612 RepID=A0A397J920_9GLOM|nr:hypothetical protein Glove_117g459 [Diversispora epigaea]
MTRPSKNTQGRRTNLKKANAALYAARQKASNEPYEIIDLPLSSDSDDENNEETDLTEELISCEAPELDNENTALELFNHLFKQAKICGRPAIYTGLAPRTIRQKKQHLREAAIGTGKISLFFPVHSKQPIKNLQNKDNKRNDYGNEQSENNEETEGNEKSKEEDNNPQYKKKFKIQLSEKKIEASLAVAKIHRRGEYRARCIQKWAEYCFEGGKLWHKK